jgi:trehalose 6-phosphate synthase/phosphatase
LSISQLKYESSKGMNRFVSDSNRLSVVRAKGAADKCQIIPISCGLVTALAPILRNQGDIWVWWTGSSDKYFPNTIPVTASTDTSFNTKLIILNQEEITHCIDVSPMKPYASWPAT